MPISEISVTVMKTYCEEFDFFSTKIIFIITPFVSECMHVFVEQTCTCAHEYIHFNMYSAV